MRNSLENLSFRAYLGAAFVFMFAGVGPGRGLLIISLFLLVAHLIRQRRLPEIPATAWWALAYLVWITVALYWGPTDTMQISQIYKNLAWLNIPVAAILLSSADRRRDVITALALGTVVLSFRVMWSVAATVWKSMREGIGFDPAKWTSHILFHRQLDESDILARLVSQGGMQDGQRLVIGLVVLFACGWLCTHCARIKGWQVAATVLAFLAFFLSFKRGPWVIFLLLCLIVVIGYFVSWNAVRRVRSHLGAVGLAVVLLALGGLLWIGVGERDSIARFSEQIDAAAEKGGRVCMWFEVTPALIREYPFGIGFKALSNEMMKDVAPHVESGQTHVHSNLLQSLIDGGWIGMLLFGAWMISAFRDVALYTLRAPPGSSDHVMSRALFLILVALVGMGFVEYQLASGQMVLLYGTVMGMAAAGARHTDKPRE